ERHRGRVALDVEHVPPTMRSPARQHLRHEVEHHAGGGVADEVAPERAGASGDVEDPVVTLYRRVRLDPPEDAFVGEHIPRCLERVRLLRELRTGSSPQIHAAFVLDVSKHARYGATPCCSRSRPRFVPRPTSGTCCTSTPTASSASTCRSAPRTSSIPRRA